MYLIEGTLDELYQLNKPRKTKADLIHQSWLWCRLCLTLAMPSYTHCWSVKHRSPAPKLEHQVVTILKMRGKKKKEINIKKMPPSLTFRE